MFKTLDDLKKEEEEKEGTDTYAGGASSGMAVHSGAAQNIVDKANQPGGAKGGGNTDIKITLFKDGFTVDNGSLRNYEDPVNKTFLDELHKGYVPKEIQNNYTKDVSVGLEDKRDKKYEAAAAPEPPKYMAYQGSGQKMGDVESKGLEVNIEIGSPLVDKDQPITKINFRFHNGTTALVEFNQTHFVGHIYEYVNAVAPVQGTFNLVSGFPPKPLSDKTITLKEAKLINTSVIQKLL